MSKVVASECSVSYGPDPGGRRIVRVYDGRGVVSTSATDETQPYRPLPEVLEKLGYRYVQGSAGVHVKTQTLRFHVVRVDAEPWKTDLEALEGA